MLRVHINCLMALPVVFGPLRVCDHRRLRYYVAQSETKEHQVLRSTALPNNLFGAWAVDNYDLKNKARAP